MRDKDRESDKRLRGKQTNSGTGVDKKRKKEKHRYSRRDAKKQRDKEIGR